MKSKILALATLTLTACSPSVNKENARVEFQNAVEKQDSRIDSPLVTSVEMDTQSACDTLNNLVPAAMGADKERFSLFKVINSDGEARMDVRENQFVQMILGEQFKMSSEEDFFKLVEEKYQKGKISGFKRFLVKSMRFLGMGGIAQYMGTNSAIEENFPGVYGDSADLASSMHYKLAKRAVEQKSPDSLNEILTLGTPLFKGTTWKDFTEDSRKSLSAAIRAMRTDDAKERACAYVLLQRAFSQLVALKGYRAPKFEKDGTVEKISRPDPVFNGSMRSGAFVDRATGKAIALLPESIAAYDPDKGSLTTRAELPALNANDAAGSLSDGIAMMEGLLFNFEATSPASPWVKVEVEEVHDKQQKQIKGALIDTGLETVSKKIKSSNYMLGDITAEEGIAILPDKANSLALGLLSIHFKNLKATYIKKVTLYGTLVRGQEKAAGMVISETGADDLAEVRLDSVLSLARVTAYLEGALSRFKERNLEDWSLINGAYDLKTLESLVGNGGLQSTLLSLKLPIAVLATEFAKDGRCASKLEWNLNTGARRSVEECTNEQVRRLADTLEVLGRSAHSVALLQRADELRRR